jgi:tetratricopeptide (TPR) repeat protein
MQLTAQENQLAYQYFRNGDYEKAAALYKSLLEKNPYNTGYFNYLLDCYQQLNQYSEAHNTIENQFKKFPNQYYLYVEQGYLYQLQHQQEKANELYQKALVSIEKEPNLGYLIGRSFQDNHLLDFALQAYRKTMDLNPKANYNYQIAAIYGEKAEVGNMFNTYLDMIEANPNYMVTAKGAIARYINDDSESEYNSTLRTLLLKRLQNNPQNSWNELLSWLFMQQKEFDKALIQEKALFKRNANNLNEIIEIGKIAFDEKEYNASKSCFHFVLENTADFETVLIAKLYLLEMDMDTNAAIESIENQFTALFNQYGNGIETLQIQAVYAEFLAFKKNDYNKAINVLNHALKLTPNEFQQGYLKTKLADIYVYNGKFNSALIQYTQVQNSLKNHVIGQTARFKIAQTSYFKGDFNWAQSQLKILKNSTSQLIANDALDLNLLITDNAVKDSLKIALKKYAVADLLAFQNKNTQAIDTLQYIIETFKEHPIIDEALFKQAQLFEKSNNFSKAENNYLQIIALNNEDILADDAHYYLAELYLNKLNNEEKAKVYYQKIIFDYPSSIFLVPARKKFRILRGEAIN